MNKLRVGFLYNVRHNYPDPDNLKSQLETDFDDQETISCIIEHLQTCGFDVIPIEADEDAYNKLQKSKSQLDIVLNYSEGLNGLDRECHLPAMMEMLRIPYTGSSPLTQAIVLDKAITKDVLRSQGLPVLPHRLFNKREDIADLSLQYPQIIKPVSQGSSAGITNASIVHSLSELESQISSLLATLGPPVMAEPLLDGREFSVSMIGNEPVVLPAIEPDHSLLPSGFEKIDSLEVKWYFEETDGMEKYLLCPAPITKEQKDNISIICRGVWTALRIRDYCRIDLRCDSEMNFYVIEVNSPPGLIPPEISKTSYFPLAARTAGIGYDDLLKLIVETAWKRVSVEK